jgi:hypothetical protein
MADFLQIFISCSGNKSRAVAQALCEWLPNVIQSVAPQGGRRGGGRHEGPGTLGLRAVTVDEPLAAARVGRRPRRSSAITAPPATCARTPH